MTARIAVALATMVLLAGPPELAAQRAGNVPQTNAQRFQDSAGRARLELEIRRAFARAVRQRVGLSDEQIARLVPMTQRHEQQRRQLLREEREARMALRALLRDEQSADQGKVDQLLRQLVDIQKRRIQLVESEQREFATVMTPVQRAKFMALQEQVRRRLEQMRQRRAAIPDGDIPPAQRPPQRPPQRPR